MAITATPFCIFFGTRLAHKGLFLARTPAYRRQTAGACQGPIVTGKRPDTRLARCSEYLPATAISIAESLSSYRAGDAKVSVAFYSEGRAALWKVAYVSPHMPRLFSASELIADWPDSLPRAHATSSRVARPWGDLLAR